LNQRETSEFDDAREIVKAGSNFAIVADVQTKELRISRSARVPMSF
jgi:hypothetical protein